MRARRTHVAVAFAMATMLLPFAARAGEAEACATRITRETVVSCALATSLGVKAERQGLEAAEAKRTAVSPLLPSNPVLALSAGRRSIPATEATNWYATLSQEIEIAGQRGLRRDAAEAGVLAQTKRVVVARREVAAAALTAFYESLAAREELRLAERLTTATQRLGAAARARAEQGLIAPIDADVADAAALRVLQLELAANRRAAEGRLALATLLGLDPARGGPAVDGELQPLVGLDEALAGYAAQADTNRPEVAVADAQRRAEELRADAYRRSRVPNPTVSVFAQNDGFNERVLGMGVSFPIPLPGNVGRTFVGEIAEAEALARRNETERGRVQREIRLEVATAAQAYASRTKEVAAFSEERVTRAEASLGALGEEVEGGRLAVRDAVIAQQALIDLLRANVEARRAWCLASVDLARAVGMPLEGRAP